MSTPHPADVRRALDAVRTGDPDQQLGAPARWQDHAEALAAELETRTATPPATLTSAGHYAVQITVRNGDEPLHLDYVDRDALAQQLRELADMLTEEETQ